MSDWLPETWLHQIRVRRRPLFRTMARERHRHAETLRAILDQHRDRPVIVYLPTVDWSFLRQRPQQLALALAEAGALFLYMAPCNTPDGFTGIQESAPGLYVCRFDYRLFGIIPDPVVWVSWTINRRFLPYFGPHRLVYDILDELEVFDGYGPAMERDHRRLMAEADTVFAVSRPLLEKARRARPDTLLCANAADFDHFAATPTGPPPDDLRPALDGSRCIGYVGALARWIDYARIRAVARQDPRWRIVLIGPDYDGTLRPSGLLDEPNVHWLGPKEYGDLPAYVSRFDIALIPFVQGLDLTDSVSPIKLYEYAAAGVPVVVSDVAECRDIREIRIAATDAAFVDAVAREATGNEREALRDFARKNSWRARAETILAALHQAGKSGRHP